MSKGLISWDWKVLILATLISFTIHGLISVVVQKSFGGNEKKKEMLKSEVLMNGQGSHSRREERGAEINRNVENFSQQLELSLWLVRGAESRGMSLPLLMSLSTVAQGPASCVLWGLSIEASPTITQAHHWLIVMAPVKHGFWQGHKFQTLCEHMLHLKLPAQNPILKKI